MARERAPSVKILIKEAELSSGSADFVYRFYFEQSKVNKDHQSEDIDEYTEKRLLEKNDAFIDLTLAQYCLYPETLGSLFRKSKTDKNLSLTLACISNTTVARRKYAWTKQPEALFKGGTKEAMGVWFKLIKNEELDALFRNPTLEDDFLVDVLEGKKYWADLNDEQRRIILIALCNNPRVATPYDDTVMDGYAEYSHGRVPAAIWKLAETLPVASEWAVFLSSLLEKTVGGSHGMDLMEVAKRWDVVDPEEKPDKKKQFLSPFESVRCALYKESGKIKEPYGKDRVEARAQFFEAEDIAFRAAVYNTFALAPEEIEKAYGKDALLAFQYMVENLQIWKNPKSRKMLHDVAWDSDGKYNNNHLDSANHYNWKEKELEEKYPGWFKENEEEKDEGIDDQQAFLSKMFEIDGKLDMGTDKTDQILATALVTREFAENSHAKLFSSLQEIYALLNNVQKQVRPIGWIFWVLVVVLLVVLYKH